MRGRPLRAGVPILTSGRPESIPPVSRLESTVLFLEAKGDLRNLVRMVEAWSEIAEPSIPAMVSAAHAYVELGLMDRAWVRLQPLIESGRGGRRAVTVAARMFLARGWNARARQLLQRTMPDHPGDRTLVELWDKASESGTTDLPPHPDESDGTAALCEHAWLLMARSSFVKAQALLENLRRSDPDATRVADLLWALEGDFLAREPIGSLAARLGPSLALLTDVGDPEHTEAASKAEIAAALAPDDKSTSGMFPGLFRNTTAEDELLPGAAPGAEEVTKITRMSEIERIAENQEFISDFGDTASSGDDTQILLVVHRGENKAPPTTEEVDNSFDLGAIKREMRAHGSDDIRHLEGEDDDIIIHTRVEDTAELEPDPTTDVSILELHHENPSAEAAQLVDEAAEWVKRRPVHHLSAQATHPMVQRRDKHRRSASRNVPRWTFWAAAGATAVIFGIAAIGLVVLVRLLFGLIL